MKYLNNIRAKANILGTSPIGFFYEEKSNFGSFSDFIGQFLTFHAVPLFFLIIPGLMNIPCDTALISFSEELIKSAAFL